MATKTIYITRSDQEINGLVIGILAGDGEVPALHCLTILGGDLLPEVIESIHGALQLLLQPVHNGGAGPVGGRPGPAPWEAACGGVGAVEGLQLDLEDLGLFESECHVNVHAGTKVLHGGGVVKCLVLFVVALETLANALQLLHLVLDRLDVAEELVQVGIAGGRCGGGNVDDAVVRRRRRVVAAGDEGFGEQVIHRTEFGMLAGTGFGFRMEGCFILF